jgi:hypothetical protein
MPYSRQLQQAAEPNQTSICRVEFVSKTTLPFIFDSVHSSRYRITGLAYCEGDALVFDIIPPNKPDIAELSSGHLFELRGMIGMKSRDGGGPALDSVGWCCVRTLNVAARMFCWCEG